MTENNNIEYTIKEKMGRLADSVDCFDVITDRVFPKVTGEFSESGFTVSSVENVTGRAKNINVVRWASVAAAAVICFAILPRTDFGQRFFSNVRNNGEVFDGLMTEINLEVTKNDYSFSDYTFEYYSEYPYLVNPFFDCPFEDTGKENINVRVYTRTINDYGTNQIYAVEYADEFSEENIIAVASSGVRFSEEDAERASAFSEEDFSGGIDANTSRIVMTIINVGDVLPVVTEIERDGEEDDFSYVINSWTSTPDNRITYKGAWEKSVYTDDKPALPNDYENVPTIITDFTKDEETTSPELYSYFYND